MLQITNIQEVNYKISQESLKQILKNADMVRDYTCKEKMVDVVSYLIDRFDEEVNKGIYHDINDYIEMFILRLEEIY